MAALPLTVNPLPKSEKEYHGKFGYTLGNIQCIALISIIAIFNTYCCLATQILAPIIPGFQGIKLCVQYLDIHPHKPTFYPSNSYDGSNVTRLTWIGNQV